MHHAAKPHELQLLHQRGVARAAVSGHQGVHYQVAQSAPREKAPLRQEKKATRTPLARAADNAGMRVPETANDAKQAAFAAARRSHYDGAITRDQRERKVAEEQARGGAAGHFARQLHAHALELDSVWRVAQLAVSALQILELLLRQILTHLHYIPHASRPTISLTLGEKIRVEGEVWRPYYNPNKARRRKVAKGGGERTSTVSMMRCTAAVMSVARPMRNGRTPTTRRRLDGLENGVAETIIIHSCIYF